MDWKKICKKLLFPPAWLMAVLTVLSAVSLALVFTKGWDASPVAYACYVLSFYTLSVVTLFFIVVFPGWYKRAKSKIYANEFGSRYMTDAKFRTRVSLYLSLGINLLYVAVNLFSGFWYQTAWFGILAVYYAILAVMRFLLLRFVNQVGIGRDLRRELRRSRLCAAILLTLNLILTGAVLMILYQDKGYEYNGVLIYVMALYTFYTTTHAIIDLVKYRKLGSPVMSTAKVISLAAALVSMLSLETAMFSQFGGDMPKDAQRLMIALTGGGVSLAVISLSVYTIIQANRKLKK